MAPPLLFLSALVAASPAIASEADTWCRPQEIRYFDCVVVGQAQRVASLCGHDTEPRWLQYRFGRLGRTPELQVPATLQDPAMGTTFFFESGQTRDGQVNSLSIWFRHVDATYVLSYVVQQDDAPAESTDLSIWDKTMHWPPRSLSCESDSGGKALVEGSDLIGAMSPPGREWHLSPLDEMHARRRAAATRAASSAQR